MDVGALRSMPSLQAVDLSSCHMLRDIAPLGNAAHLDSLDVSNCDNLQQLHPILTCRKLTSLTLTVGQDYDNISAVCACVPKVHWAEPEYDDTSSEESSGNNDLADMGQHA